MTEIPLTRSMVALIDDEELWKVAGINWQATPPYMGRTSYAVASGPRTNVGGVKRRGKIRMHRLIMNAPKGSVVDHINGDGLDNRKQNLRIASYNENGYNSVVQRNSVTGYTGVSVAPRAKGPVYKSTIYVLTKGVHLGYFATSEEAALAYNNAALELHGEFANLNIIRKVAS